MAVRPKPYKFESYYIDLAIGRIGKGKMNTHLSAREQHEFRKMMEDAGWTEHRQYGGPHHKQVFYKNKYTVQQIYRHELLMKSPHEFSSFIYASKMEYEAEKSQAETGFMERMCYEDYEKRQQRERIPSAPSGVRSLTKRATAIGTAVEPKSGIELWEAGQSSWARQPAEYLRQRVEKWIK